MSDRADPDSDFAIADALEDFHRRRGRGEVASVDDYRASLGDSHEDFRAIVEAETTLDDALSPPAPDSLPRPFGPYTLLRELGRGAAGVVYEAVHRELGRTVALKVLRTGFDTDATALERFRREARACAQVRHDRIVAIFEVGEVEGRPFYAMDLVPGETLAQRIRSDRLLPPEELCRGLAGIAEALQALHDAGIVHRDVKPSNVMVRPDGRMILADFGLARSAQTATLTRTGDALGTPLYMSPEQVLGQRAEIDARTDVYGLGATLYEGLTGRPVFQADEMAALMKMILSERPVPPRAAKPSLPEACERIALKCLEKGKKDRYPTASALADDLGAFAAGRRVEGRPVAPFVRGLRLVRKRWVPIAASIALAAGGVTWWLSRPTKLVVVALWPEQLDVFADGTRAGRTSGAPFDVPVAPGWHKFRYEADGMDPAVDEFSLERGTTIPKKVLLFPSKGNTKGVLAFRERFHVDPPESLDVARFAETGRIGTWIPRGSEEPAVLPLLPRGDVRLEDLDRVYVRSSEATPNTGALVFRRGGDVVGRVAPLDTPSLRAWVAVPESVRSALRVGDVVAWGWEPAKGEAYPPRTVAATATFRVVDGAALAEDLARLAEIASPDSSAGALLAVQALREHGLETAAFRAAYAAAKRRPDDGRAWAAVWSALDRWALDRTEFADEVHRWIGAGFAPRSGVDVPSLEPPDDATTK